MPGLDGTGALFENFATAAPDAMAPVVASYPPDEAMSYEQLAPIATAMLPTGGRCILVAESFSGPLALRVAAGAPPGDTLPWPPWPGCLSRHSSCAATSSARPHRRP